jgi:hypothetical protein
VNTEPWNAALTHLGRQFAVDNWQAMKPGHLTALVGLLQGLQGLAREDRLCSADIQRVILSLVVEVGSQTQAEIQRLSHA